MMSLGLLLTLCTDLLVDPADSTFLFPLEPAVFTSWAAASSEFSIPSHRWPTHLPTDFSADAH